MTRVARVRSVRAWRPSTGPTACALAGRRCSLWGWRKGVPGGGALQRCEGRLRSGAPPPPTARPLGGPLGSATHVLWAPVCGCGCPTLSPSPACPVGAACGGGGGGPSPGGVACHRCEGRLVSGAVPPPAARPLERAAGVPRPVCPGCGRCGCGDPAPAPRRAPLRAGVARSGAGGREPSGGVPSAVVRGVWGRALFLPRLPALWAGCRGPLPTGCGCGGARAWAPVANPTACALASWLFALWGRHEGARGGGASCLGVGCPGSDALPAPAARPLGGLHGSTTHWLWVRGGAGVGTRHQPHSARSCVLWGRHEGARGGRLLPGCEASGVGRSPSPDCPPSGRAAGAHYPLAVGAGRCGRGDPSPTPQRALVSWLCALWGRHEGARGGRLLPGYGASGVGRSPTPDCPPSGRAAGAHYPLAVGAGGCGRGDLSPTPQRALLRAGFARCGGGTRAPGGGASCLGVGCLGLGALPPPTARPLGGLPGPTIHWLWVRGGAGVGTRHQPHSARSCVLWGGMRVPGGGASGLGVGCPGLGALPPPTARPLGGLPGPTTHWLWVQGGAGVGTRHQPHSARSCVLWGRHEGAWGGRLLPGRGASGVGSSPTPDCPPSGRAAGAHYPLAVGGGGCGRGDPSPAPQRALLRAGFARCRGATRAPRGGASCLGVGRPGSGALRSPTARPLGGLTGPTTHWLWVQGGAGVGARHQLHSAHSCELALRAVGAA